MAAAPKGEEPNGVDPKAGLPNAELPAAAAFPNPVEPKAGAPNALFVLAGALLLLLLLLPNPLDPKAGAPNALPPIWPLGFELPKAEDPKAPEVALVTAPNGEDLLLVLLLLDVNGF